LKVVVLELFEGLLPLFPTLAFEGGERGVEELLTAGDCVEELGDATEIYFLYL